MENAKNDVVLNDYKDVIDEFKRNVIPQIFKKELLPGYSRPTIVQLERQIKRMPQKNMTNDKSMYLVAAGIILGETLVKTIDGAEWLYDAPNLQLLRVKMPVPEGQENIYAVPIMRTINYFTMKDTSKSLVQYYDQLYKQYQSISEGG